MNLPFEELATDIKMKINSEPTGSGFYPINCPMCKNRHQKEKKGGFRFEGTTIIYNCFRGSCDATTVFERGESVPKKFRALMKEMGVKIPIELLSVRRKVRQVEEIDDRFEKVVHKSLTMPSDFTTSIPESYINMLIERNVVNFDFDFLYANSGKFKGCLVVPNFLYDRLIGWDYVTRDGNYMTATESNSDSLFIPGRKIHERPIVVEGIFDALCFPRTAATKRPDITRKQAYQFRNSKPIVIPDRHRNGERLYLAAKHYEWDVSLPPWKVKDLSAAVAKYGIYVTAKMVRENIMKAGNKSDIIYKRWLNE